MKKFILRLFLAGVLIFLNCFFHFLYLNKRVPLVYEPIQKSMEQSNAEELILGDSTSSQVFGAKAASNSSLLNLSANRGVTLAGHYILAQNALARNDRIKRISLFLHPGSFHSEAVFPVTTLFCFFAPFWNQNNSAYCTDALSKVYQKSILGMFQLEILPIYSLVEPPMEFIKEKQELYFSEVSIDYLKKLAEESRKRKIVFRVLSCPISQKLNVNYETCKSFMKQQIRDNGLEDPFRHYFDDMLVLEDSCFRDFIHYKNEYAETVSKRIVQTYFSDQKW